MSDTDTYSFAAKADRIIAVRLTWDGKILPFTLRRSSPLTFSEDGKQEGEITLKPGRQAKFKIVVPFFPNRENSAVHSRQLLDWGGSDSYITPDGNFMGTPWPFGREIPQKFIVGQEPGGGANVKPLTEINYTFTRHAKGSNLDWSCQAGLTVQNGSLNLLPKAGGGAVLVVLRLRGACVGSIEFDSPGFGLDQTHKSFTVVPAPAIPKPPLDEIINFGRSFAATNSQNLMTAVAAINTAQQVQWALAKAANIREEFLEPFHRAINEHAYQKMLETLKTTDL